MGELDEEEEEEEKDKYRVYVETQNGKKQYSAKEWAKAVTGYRNTRSTWGLKKGSRGMRFGTNFEIKEKPQRSEEAPIENSMWADIEYEDGCGRVYAFVSRLDDELDE